MLFHFHFLYYLVHILVSSVNIVFTRDSIYAIARVFYHLSVHLSVTRVYHTKTVEVRIMKFLPCGTPMTLVFAG